MKTLPRTRRRRVPVVFRISLMLLIAAACFGGWWRGQPVGVGTRLITRGLTSLCPAAISPTTVATVADGAHAGDRVAWALLADRLLPRAQSRCAAKIKAMNQAQKRTAEARMGMKD